MSNRYEEFSGSENEDGFDEDMEALRRACMITGTNANDLDKPDHLPSTSAAAASSSAASGALSSDSEDDLELVRDIHNRLALSDHVCEPLSLEALCTLPAGCSDDEDDDDDFETLRVIQQRFSAYHRTDNANQVPTSSVPYHSNLFVNEINANARDKQQEQPSASIEWHEGDAFDSMLSPEHLNFPKSAQVFIDSIKKNRTYQNFIRSKLLQIEARLEENKKLKERVKILKEFQASCRRMTGRALSQRKDPRTQLISSHRNSKDSAICNGPEENSHVANYRMALAKYPISLHRKKWSKAEKGNLGKGIRQQFQELMLQLSMDRPEASLDNILATIKDIEVTPEMIREFLPKVNWDQLASMYVEGRTGAECEAQWLNFEDPLINHEPWTNEEEKSLLLTIQAKGVTNWSDIANSLGTNRTPFQCLAHYQRSLNACILKREWTQDEDEQLRVAVETFGEKDWQSVASTLEGRAGTQCSNRWKKTLHPMRQRVGRWCSEEDKHLTVAKMLFGGKNWNKIAQFVPGRTQVQCRERWVNSLDPSVNRGEWSEEEDLRLEAAVAEHGHCWTKVAGSLGSRTDNQCWRRWKLLHPHEVSKFQAARKIQKAALISNFVDREQHRPALGPNDFLPLPTSEPDNVVDSSRKRKRNKRRRSEPAGKEKDVESACNARKKMKTKRCTEEAQGDGSIETSDQCDAILKKKTVKPRSQEKNNGGSDIRNKSCRRGPNSKRTVKEPRSGKKKIDDTANKSSKRGSNSKRRDLKSHSRSNKSTRSSEEHVSSEKFMLPGTIDGAEQLIQTTLLRTTESEVNDLPVGDDVTRKKRACKLPVKRKVNVELGDQGGHGLLSPHETRSENLSMEGSNKAVKQCYRKKRRTTPSGESQGAALASCQQEGGSEDRYVAMVEPLKI